MVVTTVDADVTVVAARDVDVAPVEDCTSDPPAEHAAMVAPRRAKTSAPSIGCRIVIPRIALIVSR
jgi:hypothetical protein